MSSPWRVRNSSCSDGSGQSSTIRRPPGRSARPGRAQHRRCVGQLVERVLEVGEVELAHLARLGHARVPDGDPVRSARPPRPWPGHARPNPPRTRRRRAPERREPARHRDEPAAAAAVDVHDPSAPRQVGDELGQRGQRLLEEDRDVLRGQPLDRDRGSGPAARGSASPVRKKSTIPPQSSEATAAWTNWPPRYSGRPSSRRIDGDVVVHRQPAVLERHEVVRVGGPGPRLDRGRLATGARRELVRGQPGRPGTPGRGRTARARSRGR